MDDSLYSLILNSRRTSILVGEIIFRGEDSCERKRVGLLYEIENWEGKEYPCELIETNLEHYLGISKFARKRAKKIAAETGRHFSEIGFKVENLGEIVFLERPEEDRWGIPLILGFGGYEDLNNHFGNPIL